MTSQLDFNSVSLRLVPYILELQALLGSHGVPFGSPAALAALAGQLSSGSALADETSASIRSIIFRENEGITQGELLEILAAALGGPEVDLQSPELRTPVRQLLAFLGGALRTFWKTSPDGPLRSRLAEDTPRARLAPRLETPLPASEFPSPAQALEHPESSARETIAAKPIARSTAQHAMPARHQVRVYEEIEVREETQVREEIQVRDEIQATPVTEELYRPAPSPAFTLPFEPEAVTPARQTRPMPSASPDRFGDPAPFSDPVAAVLPATEPGGFPEYRPLHLFKATHWPLWITGLGGVAVGTLFGFLLHGQPGAGPAPVRQAVPAESSPRPATKPSPYSLPHNGSFSGITTAPNGISRAASAPGTALLKDKVIDPVTKATDHSSGRVGIANSVQLSGNQGNLDLNEGGLAPEPGGNAVAERSSVSATEGIYLSASGAMAANLVAAPAPVYPVPASEAGVQGKVVVQALVGRNGRVIDAHVISGDPLLREAALNAVRGWRYRPFITDGRTAEVETLATLDFRLFQRPQ